MNIKGKIVGFAHRYEEPVGYELLIGEEQIYLNEWIGQDITIQHTGQITCVHCGRKIKKTYNNGSCYPCFTTRPDNDLCIVKPHECHFEKGTCRDEDFAHTHCMIPHYVYLAISSGVKVGITRKNNEKKRWVDQGAVRAFPIAEVPTRKMAGEIEIILSQHIGDKTNWRKMLKSDIDWVDLKELRENLMEKIPSSFQSYLLREEEWTDISYPYGDPLEKITAYNLDKQPIIEDRLIGIKGSYLLFSKGVLNIRKYAGYEAVINVNTPCQTNRESL